MSAVLYSMVKLPTALAAMVVMGCVRAPSVRTTVTVVVRGDALEVGRANATLLHDTSLRQLGIDVRTVGLTAPLEVQGMVEPALDEVRGAYDAASWQRCLEPISEPQLVPRFLAAGKRDSAARVLFWRAACLLLKGDEPGARTVAREFAALDLAIPSEKSDPLVARILVDAALDASRTAPIALRVTSGGPELSVSCDGRAAMCVTPCPMLVRRGKHTLRVEADGRAPEDRDVLVEGAPVEARFDPPPASPELAARQWVSRWASSPSIDSQPSLHLLADATRARNLALIVTHGGTHPSVRGALTIDGAVRARAEREGSGGIGAVNTLHELLVSGRVVESSSAVQKPLFWIVLIAVAGVTAGLTYYAATLPHTVTVRP